MNKTELSKSGSAVVGVDGSSDSYNTTRWAAGWAAKNNLPLSIVMVTPKPSVPRRSRASQKLESSEYLSKSQSVTNQRLDTAEEEAKKIAPELSTEKQLLDGDTAGVLVEISKTAEMVIIGSRGAGRALLAIGGVADSVVTNAEGNVITVPSGFTASDGPIVAGIDDDDRSIDTLRFAFDQAEKLGRDLVIVHAWYAPPAAGEAASVILIDPDEMAEECRALINDYASQVSPDYPNVKFTPKVYNSNPADALVDESKSASMIVVSSRGRGGFTGLLLGSTSRSIVRASHCPVAVIRKAANAVHTA